MRIPVPGVLASALAINKVMTKRVLAVTNIPTPNYLAVDPDLSLDLQYEGAVDLLGLPLVLKPTSEGSSVGVSIRLSNPLTHWVQEIAVNTHKAIGCWGVSRVDMMIDADGQPYVTEINTLPGLNELSDLPAQAAAGGISYDELIQEILASAMVTSRTD